MEQDRYGLALGTASAAAGAAYREGIDLLLSGFPDADLRLQQAIAADPAFALAHAALARHRQIYGRLPEARAALADALTLASAASVRERGHVQLLALSVEGRAREALEALLAHLDEWPRDALALSLALGAFGLFAFSGRADHDAARLALCRRLAPRYGDDWWFLTHLGWSHTEAGELEAGRRITQRALELRRANAHGAHALLHYFAEAGDASGGLEFAEAWLPAYERRGMLFSHLQWHRALWRLEGGDRDAALQIYVEMLRPANTLAPPINVLSDCASLLWRLLLQGEERVDWREVHAYAQERFPGPAAPFIEWHLAMAAAGAADREALERRALRDGLLRDVCRALASFAAGNHREAASLLEPHVADFVRLGGSGAQRAVLEQTLEAARARLGNA